jgi:hypothetical protein
MKQKVMTLVLIMGLIGLLYQSGCKTGEDCTFDITGSWQLSFVITGVPLTFADVVTFSGAAASGTATGFSSWVDMVGNYTVSNCTTVMFTYPDSSNDVWTFNGSSSSDTTMTGTLTRFDDSAGTTDTGTWTANKL